MSATTIGVLPKKVSSKDIYEFLKKNKDIVEIKFIELPYKENVYSVHYYSIKFRYSYGDKFEDRDLMISEYEEFDIDGASYWGERLNLDKCFDYYTYMNLDSYGCSIDIISSILAEFGGGYLIPNDYNEKVIKVDKDNINNLDLY